MKLQILFCVLAVMSSLCAYVHAVPAHCTVAGDPHFKTFDGVIYDYQATGDFVLAENSKIQVQGRFQRCTQTLSCVRSTAIELRALNPSFTVIWGSFPAMPAYPAVNGTFSFPATAASAAVVDNVWIYSSTVISHPGCTWDAAQFGLSCPLSALATAKDLGGMYRVQSVGNKAVFVTQFAGEGVDGVIGARVVMGNLTTVVTMPEKINYISQTWGLCGHYDKDPSVELVNYNRTVVVLDTRADEVYGGGAVNDFANTWKITDPTKVLFGKTQHHSLSSVAESVYSGTFVPTKAEFASKDAEAKAEAACRAMPHGDQKRVFEHCMYDHAVVGDNPIAYDMAYSNSLAAQFVAQTEQEYQQGLNNQQEQAVAQTEESGASNQTFIAMIGAGGVFTVLAAIVVIRARARRS